MCLLVIPLLNSAQIALLKSALCSLGCPLLTHHPSHEWKDHHSHTTVKNLHSTTRSLPSDSPLPVHWHFQVHLSILASCPWTSYSTSVLLKTSSNTQRKPAYEIRFMVCMSELFLASQSNLLFYKGNKISLVFLGKSTIILRIISNLY